MGEGNGCFDEGVEGEGAGLVVVVVMTWEFCVAGEDRWSGWCLVVIAGESEG